jgi:hypothetical protein
MYYLYYFRHYIVGRQLTSAAPECEPPVWKIYDAVTKQDGKVFMAKSWKKKH